MGEAAFDPSEAIATRCRASRSGPHGLAMAAGSKRDLAMGFDLIVSDTEWLRSHPPLRQGGYAS